MQITEHYANALLLLHLNIPWMPIDIEGFFIPHADVQYGNVAANDQGEPSRA